MSDNNNEVTTGEIMEFLQENMVMKKDLKQELKAFATKEDLKGFATKTDFRAMQQEILDGVDKKLVNLKGDLIVMMRGEDQKVVGLIDLLKNKAVITEIEAKQLLIMQPFPQLMG